MKLLINLLKCMVVLVLFFGLISCLIVFSIAPMFDRKPTSVGTAGSGKFELKNECYKEFNPYFYHYCRTDQSQVR